MPTCEKHPCETCLREEISKLKDKIKELEAKLPPIVYPIIIPYDYGKQITPWYPSPLVTYTAGDVSHPTRDIPITNESY